MIRDGNWKLTRNKNQLCLWDFCIWLTLVVTSASFSQALIFSSLGTWVQGALLRWAFLCQGLFTSPKDHKLIKHRCTRRFHGTGIYLPTRTIKITQMYLGKYTIHGWYGVSKQGILDILILGKNSYNPRAQRFLLPPSTVPNVEETQEGPYDAWDQCFSTLTSENIPSEILTWNLKMAPLIRRFQTWKPSCLGSRLNLGRVQYIDYHFPTSWVWVMNF